MLLPPGYALSRKNCVRFKSPVYPRIDVPVDTIRASSTTFLREAVRRGCRPGCRSQPCSRGGIDSTLVAHYARQLRPEAPGYFVGGTDAPDYAMPPPMPTRPATICAWCRSIRKARRRLRSSTAWSR